MAEGYIAVLCMAAATFTTRAAGPWLLQRITLPRYLNTVLEYLPGTIMISLVAAQVSKLPTQEWPAVAVALLVGFRTKNVFLTILVGVLAVYVIRNI